MCSSDLFKQAGISTPWTPKSWDDVLAAAQQIKDKTGVEDAFLLPAGSSPISIGVACFAILFLLWAGLAVMRKFV